MRGVQRGNWLELLEGKGFMLILSEPCLVKKVWISSDILPRYPTVRNLKHWGWKILEDEFPLGFRPRTVSFREGIFGLWKVDLEIEIYDGNGFMTMGMSIVYRHFCH